MDEPISLDQDVESLGLAELYGRSTFNLIEIHTDFDSHCNSFHSHQQWINAFPSYIHASIHHHLWDVGVVSNSDWGKMKSQSSSICIFPMTKDVEHCFSAVCVLSFENSYLVLCPIFLIGLFSGCSVFRSLYILDSKPLSDIQMVKNFFFLQEKKAASLLWQWCLYPLGVETITIKSYFSTVCTTNSRHLVAFVEFC